MRYTHASHVCTSDRWTPSNRMSYIRMVGDTVVEVQGGAGRPSSIPHQDRCFANGKAGLLQPTDDQVAWCRGTSGFYPFCTLRQTIHKEVSNWYNPQCHCVRSAHPREQRCTPQTLDTTPGMPPALQTSVSGSYPYVGLELHLSVNSDHSVPRTSSAIFTTAYVRIRAFDRTLSSYA